LTRNWLALSVAGRPNYSQREPSGLLHAPNGEMQWCSLGTLAPVGLECRGTGIALRKIFCAATSVAQKINTLAAAVTQRRRIARIIY